ncbi:MAG TPA: prolyl oligopeptidase family serine peptidase, partial [Longimicrobiales bacterium]|nr:prolyl oligopeptidase family serine peptidase [Longimicrobiales bacterium]
MIQGVDPSPDGRWFRVTSMRGPLSYIVPTSSAATVEEVWSEDGRVVAPLNERPLRDGSDRDDDDEENGQEERRGLTWRVDGPGLTYLQMEPAPDTTAADSAAADTVPADTVPADTVPADTVAADSAGPGAGGQQRRSPRMDRVIHWAPPFDSTSTEIVYATRQRINAFTFDRTGRTLFLTRRSGGGDNATERLTAVFLDDPEKERKEHQIFSHRTSKLREDPGSPLYTRAPNGTRVVRTSPDGASVYLSGTRYYEDPMVDAPRPFVDRVSIRTDETERIFESAPDLYERVSAVLDDELWRLVVTREGPTTVPDAWLVDRTTGAERRLTSNVDHTPEITAARREIVMITRPDGFRSKVQVTLPPGYRDGTRLPAMFWFYPREYTEQESYDERNLARFNKNSFPRVGSRSMEILTLLGYAVVDPDLPVVGESGQMNNNYVPDLRNTLATVIDTLDARGWIDRGRLGLGGHSYGAFGTANAMVHTPFFKAGIAGDGNYNRWLTPAGFQSERRYLWDAKQVYDEMSPFYHADRLTGALLMYHGMDDHNVGTHPDHSRRLFHALNVLGKTAALYMYPYEDHGPATQETLLDLWARWTVWLDTYVKNPGRTAEPVLSDAVEGNGGR